MTRFLFPRCPLLLQQEDIKGETSALQSPLGSQNSKTEMPGGQLTAFTKVKLVGDGNVSLAFTIKIIKGEFCDNIWSTKNTLGLLNLSFGENETYRLNQATITYHNFLKFQRGRIK
ncbi:hypothetical protein AVEN_180754-1 [Araneus ventricosus]|uniref:Uncharacterized protein n=1 Tax=Araneus ventricosus TaxID=182803 RepID=A0A4Y2V1F8_ARAVE|nr:hypothetical protein AVEN_180754-1 [Araneus ventricosus]